MNVRFTLVADGPFDSSLLPVLIRLLRDDTRVADIDHLFAPPTARSPARSGLASRIVAALSLYPADLLFVHRDAERESITVRLGEVMNAVSGLSRVTPFVAVVPVRMTEAWLLFNEAAIRRAAGNPNGNMPLHLPRLHDLEAVVDPKQILHRALVTASGRSGRALAKFNVYETASRVADLIDDFSPLLALPSYQRLNQDLRVALDRLNGV